MATGAWRGLPGALDPADAQRVDEVIAQADNLDAAVTATQEASTNAVAAAAQTVGDREQTTADRLQTTADSAQAALDREAAEIARAEAEAFAAAGATAAQFYDTIALGRAAVADGGQFGVRAGGSDGLTRPTIYRRDSASTQTVIVQIVNPSEVSGLNAAVSNSQTARAAGDFALEHIAAPGDSVVLVRAANGPVLVTLPDGTTRGNWVLDDATGIYQIDTAGAGAIPGDSIIPIILDGDGATIFGIDALTGALWPAQSGGGGGSSVTFVDPDTVGDAWNAIQTEDDHGEVIRYMSRQWRETWGYEQRDGVTLAQTPNPAIGMVAFGGAGAGLARTLPDAFPWHVVDETLLAPETADAAASVAACFCEHDFANRRGLSSVFVATHAVGSTLESDAAVGSAGRLALIAKVEAAKTAFEGWGKALFIDRIDLSLLEGAPSTPKATADAHYAATLNGMRMELATASGQTPLPMGVVTQSFGTRTNGVSTVALAEGEFDWQHWNIGAVVATPRYPFALVDGTAAQHTPEALLLIDELKDLAVRARWSDQEWYGPTMPATCTRSGAVITIPFTAMSDLVIRNPSNHGFSVNGVTNGATIASVAVSGTTVTITMTATPAGTLTVDYAYGRTGTPGDNLPANRGSLTDSWSQPSRMIPSATLYRYARSGRATVI